MTIATESVTTAIAASTAGPSVRGGTGTSVKSFQVFDGTLYKDKPDLSAYGIRPIRIIYGQELWKDKSQMSQLPNEARAMQIARAAAAKSSVVCIDIENWPVKGEGAVVADSIQKYATLMRWFKQATPRTRHGYYGVLPVGDYWRVVGGRSSQPYKEWQTENARLKPIADTVDVVFPSLYTFYPDREDWVRYAVGQIREAKKYGKPVYPFLWPQYHDSNWLLKGRYLPADYWRLELQTVLAHADGVVIWGGWDLDKDRPQKWDDQAPWWKITKRFMQQLNSH